MEWVLLSSNVSAAGALAMRKLASVPEIIVNVPSESAAGAPEIRVRVSVPEIITCELPGQPILNRFGIEYPRKPPRRFSPSS